MAVLQLAFSVRPDVAESTPGSAPGARRDSAVMKAAWLFAGLAIAAGVEPWLSQYAGVMLPAFALVRTARRSTDA